MELILDLSPSTKLHALSFELWLSTQNSSIYGSTQITMVVLHSHCFHLWMDYPRRKESSPAYGGTQVNGDLHSHCHYIYFCIISMGIPLQFHTGDLKLHFKHQESATDVFRCFNSCNFEEVPL